ncbi:phage tail spike protein [Melissococcus plutonius]|uniref:phage tail spike protein n=1 Tax=Melissococcus plutonius TaxID=33970 RepID=UPI003C2C3FB4
MLIFEDILGTVVPAYAENVEEIDTLNAFGQLNFSLLNRQENKLAFQMLVPGTKITVPESKNSYRISTNNGASIGKYKQRTITALSIARDLHAHYVDSTLAGSQSLENCLNFIFKGTEFIYTLHDKFTHFTFSEGFGNGYADDLFTNQLAKDFNFDFRFTNHQVDIYKTIGKKNQFLFIDGATVAKISESTDYTAITTHIKGYGKQNDQGKPIVSAEYTSPYAKQFGIIDAQFIQDDRFTDKESLLNYLKNQIQDYPKVQYTVDSSVFDQANTWEQSNYQVGDYGFLKDRHDIDIEVQLIGITTYPQQAKQRKKLTFGNKQLSLAQITVQLQKTKKEANNRVDIAIDMANTAKAQSDSLDKKIKELEEKVNQLTPSTPKPTQTNGLDVSEHNPDINWAKLKATGHTFVMIRVGFSVTQDKLFEQHIQNAISAGFDIGLYLFSYACSVEDAKAEANFACSLADKYKDKITYPIAFDWEESSKEYAEKQGITPTQQLVSNMAIAFLTTVKNRGYQGLNYSNLNYYNHYFDSRVKAYDWWLARPGVTSPDVPCKIWQSELDVDGIGRGINGKADFDVSYL